MFLVIPKLSVFFQPTHNSKTKFSELYHLDCGKISFDGLIEKRPICLKTSFCTIPTHFCFISFLWESNEATVEFPKALTLRERSDVSTLGEM